MMKIITYAVICLVVFGAGLGLSFVLGIPGADKPEEVETTPEQILQEVVPSDPTAELLSDLPKSAADMPIPVRDTAMSPEELFRFGETFRKQKEALAQREKDIKQQQARLKLALDDLQGSRQEFDGLRSQVRDAMAKGESLLRQLEAQRADFEMQRQQAAATEDKVSTSPTNQVDETANLKKISGWLQSMQTDKAAELLRNLSNDGNMDSALKLLSNLEDRNAATILSAMMASGEPSDTTLVAQLTEACREHQRPARTNDARAN